MVLLLLQEEYKQQQQHDPARPGPARPGGRTGNKELMKKFLVGMGERGGEGRGTGEGKGGRREGGREKKEWERRERGGGERESKQTK